MRRWLFILLLIPLFGLIGCVYRLGPTNGEKAGDRSIKVTPFENKTIEPRLIEAVSAALRRELQQDGTYKLNTGSDPDLIVTGSILKYERDAISVRPTDALSPLGIKHVDMPASPDRLWKQIQEAKAKSSSSANGGGAQA